MAFLSSLAVKGAVTRTTPPLDVCEDETVARILIVDDDDRFRRVARALLESEGFEVVGEAADGRSALAAVDELAPEVILLDIQLPDVDGLEIATRLATTNGGPAIILTSSRDESDFGDQLRRSGARGFVPKDELSAERIAALCE